MVSSENSTKRLLIVDDEDAIRFAMKDYFSNFGFKIDCARDKEEAIAILTYIEFDVVILDLNLDRVFKTEGLEIAKLIKKKSPNTYIIILTAYGSPDIEAEAKKIRVDKFLNKPVPLPTLSDAILKILDGNSQVK